MALPRESTFLPTIKCSQCGNEVEISMMGEHLCGAPATPELSPPLEAEETFQSSYQATRNKYLRTPPPVDTGAANRYLSQGQLTPVSHSSSSRNTSPKTPSARSGINRRYNDDYDPEIAQDDGPRSPRGYGRRPGGYGGFGGQTPEPEVTEAPEPAAKDAPAPSFFQRMGELAGGYGGFGMRPAEPAVEPEKPVEREPEQEPEPAKEAPGFLQRINDLAGSAFDAGRRPSAPNKSTFPQRKESLDHWDPPPDLTIPPNSQKPVRQNGYGGFNNTAYNDNGARGMTRAETFPRPAYPNDMSGRRPSGAGPQTDINRRPSAPYQQSNGSDINRRPSMGPDTSRRPPPRTSLIKHRANTSSVDLDKEFGVRNPYHTPTDSMSSGYSSHSEQSNPPMNNGPDRYIERNNSDPVSRPRQQQQQQPLTHDNNAMQRRDNNARPDLRIDPAIQAPQRGPGRFVESPYSASPRDDRYDPAIHPGLGGSRGRYESPPKQHGFDRGYGANNNNTRSNDRGYGAAPVPQPPSAPVRQGSRDPLYAPSRGDCKACRMPITGKSISSADGRLTGKYHKACFVCTTCTMPFSSAEFYVHRDRPYCEIHYHKLNGSLCGSCDRGIEGQYAEDEGRVKYHVGCFRCLDCGISLSDGYFEVDGKSYCERDAWRRVELEAPPVPEPDYSSNSNYNYNNNSSQPPPLPNGTVVPPTTNNRPVGRGMAARGTGAGMERGPYGVAPGTRTRLAKRMTRIGMM